MKIEKQLAILVVSVALALAACATPKATKVATRAEIVQRDNAVGEGLTARFEAQIKLKNDRDVSIYLRSVAQKLSDSSPELKPTSVGVLLVRDKPRIWKSYGLPGNRIYVSVGLLHELEFENEVAAVIAFELAHIQRRSLVARIQESMNPGDPSARPSPAPSDPSLTINLEPADERLNAIDFFSPNGVFVFKLEAELDAVDSAIDLLYKSGYDPRGLIGIWKAYQANPGQSPFDRRTLDKLLEHTRKSISGYAPLLNPIVRSNGFVAVQKRIKNL